jgi:hypothetical protein
MQFVRATGSDEDGRFEITDLAPGAYSVSVSSPAYVVEPETDASKTVRLGERADFTLTRGGVISGRVTNSAGEPIANVAVKATRVRDSDGRRTTRPFPNERPTDDRGIYRIYGLPAGVYIVSVGAGSQFLGFASQVDSDAPTYYPAGTRDTAQEVTVGKGEEVTAIDIRHRGDRGQRVSGRVTGQLPATTGVAISLRSVATRFVEATVASPRAVGDRTFLFNGVADGEYDVYAISPGSTEAGGASPLRRISVRGNDVTGIELPMAPFASITGSLVLEPLAGPRPDTCDPKPSTALEEALIHVRRDKAEAADEDPRLNFGSQPVATGSNGEFMAPDLIDGRYRVHAKLLNPDWWVRSIVSPVKPATAIPASSAPPERTGRDATPAANDIARGGVLIRAGQKIEVRIAIGRLAAGLSGAVTPERQGAFYPPRTVVHLIPVEREHADNPLRYLEAPVVRGAFALTNIPPGKYWLLTKATAGNEPVDPVPDPLAWDSQARTQLRREAEARNLVIDLGPCHRIADYVLKYAPAATDSTRGRRKPAGER